MMIELFHDFNNLQKGSKEGLARAFLTCNGTIKQIEQENIALFKGQIIRLIDPDGFDDNGNPDRLEVEAKISFDKDFQCWVGEFNYSCNPPIYNRYFKLKGLSRFQFHSRSYSANR